MRNSFASSCVNSNESRCKICKNFSRLTVIFLAFIVSEIDQVGGVHSFGSATTDPWDVGP